MDKLVLQQNFLDEKRNNNYSKTPVQTWGFNNKLHLDQFVFRWNSDWRLCLFFTFQFFSCSFHSRTTGRLGPGRLLSSWPDTLFPVLNSVVRDSFFVGQTHLSLLPSSLLLFSLNYESTCSLVCQMLVVSFFNWRDFFTSLKEMSWSDSLMRPEMASCVNFFLFLLCPCEG